MSDHADVIRQYVELYGPFPAGEHQRIVIAALDALVAERDEALLVERTIADRCALAEEERDVLEVERNNYMRWFEAASMDSRASRAARAAFTATMFTRAVRSAASSSAPTKEDTDD